MEKVVVLTGAYGGMGKEVVKELANNGYTIFACDLNVEESSNPNIIPMKIDITNDEDISNLVNIVKEKTDKIYCLFNLAGIFLMNSILEADEKVFKKSFDVNFFGGIKMIKAFYPLMKADYSRIINMTSEVAKYSIAPFNALYASSKIAFDSMTDALRRELKVLKIKVIKIRAGSFKTNMLDSANNEYEQLIQNTKLYKKELSKFGELMLNETNKQNDPRLIGELTLKILESDNPRAVYHIKNSRALRFIGRMPNKWQDKIYYKILSGKENKNK